MAFSNLNTEWRFAKLEKYPNRIICDDGRVYNSKGRLLSLKPSRGGYLRVRMYRSGVEIYAWVHRMVCYAFVGDCSGCDVHHVDKNIKNNHYTNFKIMTEEDHIKKHKNEKEEKARLSNNS